jgi:hypothetical protein
MSWVAKKKGGVSMETMRHLSLVSQNVVSKEVRTCRKQRRVAVSLHKQRIGSPKLVCHLVVISKESEQLLDRGSLSKTFGFLRKETGILPGR